MDISTQRVNITDSFLCPESYTRERALCAYYGGVCITEVEIISILVSFGTSELFVI